MIKKTDTSNIFINVNVSNDNDREKSCTMYGDVLGEIFSILSLPENCENIIGCDFNVNYVSQSTEMYF